MAWVLAVSYRREVEVVVVLEAMESSRSVNDDIHHE